RTAGERLVVVGHLRRDRGGHVRRVSGDPRAPVHDREAHVRAPLRRSSLTLPSPLAAGAPERRTVGVALSPLPDRRAAARARPARPLVDLAPDGAMASLGRLLHARA